MQVGILGPVSVTDDAREVAVGAAKERSLIAALALHPGSVVGADALIDALWGDAPPVSARKTLQTYVSNIRRALGPNAVATEPDGYVLSVAADAVDASRFRRLIREGEAALRQGSTSVACDKFASALQLWRGEPFGGVALHTGLAAEAVRLREEYVSALEARVGADLTAGRPRELVGELEVLVREHPFRERLWGHLMVALYESGRQADALAAYERARVLLRDELGLEPGGELRRIHHRVLVDDHSATRSSPAGATSTPQLFRSAIRYAVPESGVHVAYQTVGDGPIDVLAVPGFVSHLDMWWDAPTDTLVRRLASFSRLILFDKRGMGLSDRPTQIGVDDWVADARAVLDAAGSERAVILGISAGAPTAALFAARYPERTQALILYGGYARFRSGEDYTIGTVPAVADSFIDNMEARWGTGVGISILAPSVAKDPVAREFWARLQTTSASPSAAATFLRALSHVDVRDALPSITAPTLVLHPERDQNVSIECARFMTRLIPGARMVELDTDIHLIWLSDVVETITDEIDTFIAQFVPVEPDHLPATTRIHDEALIREVEAAYDRAWQRGDLDALLACLTDDAVMVNPRGDVARGHNEIRQAIGDFLSTEAAGTGHCSEITRVEFASDDVAVVDGKALITDGTGEGASTPRFQHFFTDVLVRVNGAWSISHVRAYTHAEDTGLGS